MFTLFCLGGRKYVGLAARPYLCYAIKCGSHIARSCQGCRSRPNLRLKLHIAADP